MATSLKTIVVDLTPVLPGGANGGAKVFVLELLRQLASLAPKTQFILLTQSAAHQELADLDRSNMRRMQVLDTAAGQAAQGTLKSLANRLLPHLPGRVRRRAVSVGFRLQALLKRKRSAGLLHQLNADLLFCPFTAPTYFEAGIPTVCTIYDLQYKTYPEFFDPADVGHRHQTFVEACRRASALTAISDYSRDSAIEHGNLDPAFIRTIHLRLAQRIAPSSELDPSALRQLDLTPGRYLVYPANFWKHKNHEMLLTAFGIACHSGLDQDIKLVCTGAPGQRQQFLATAARSMNLSERVVFPGYLPTAQLAALMNNAAGMVFPSLYEGFGLPVVEAMAAGIPVACSNTTSLPEVAAGAAMLFNPRVPTEVAQAMIELVSNRARGAELAAIGRQRAQEFSDSRRMASEYWQLFEDAIGQSVTVDSISGVYPDGWAGPELNLQVAAAESAGTVQLELLLPDWVPTPKITLRATRAGAPLGRALTIGRGRTSLWDLPLGNDGGKVQIHLSPSFVPALTGHGADHRELSSMLLRCQLLRADGSSTALYPESVTA